MKHYIGRPDSLVGRSEAEVETYDFLDKLDVDYETLFHNAAFTMDECAEVEHQLGVPIFKNLFLCNRQQTQFYLLMLPGDKVFKTKYLSAELGCSRLSFATAELMEQLLHVHPGAVSPMGLIHEKEGRVMPVIDKDLLQYTEIGCHPCVNTATLKLKLQDLMDKVIPATGHELSLVSQKSE